MLRGDFYYFFPGDDEYSISLEILEDTLIAKILEDHNALQMLTQIEEEASSPVPFDWEEFLDEQLPIFVPGLRRSPPCPRLSTLTRRQHEQCLAVICYEQRHILPNRFMRRPTTRDYAVFEAVKEQYLLEQQEYIEWAKALWVNGHNLRALRPSTVIENMYIAEYNVRVSQVRDYPMIYEGYIPVPLNTEGTFEMRRSTSYQDVNTSGLPQLRYPATIDQRLTLRPTEDILMPCPVHPVRFVLPGERTVTNMVATDIHVRLAEYAGAREVPFVAREAALRCLVENRYWALTVSICSVRWNDGKMRKVVVLGCEMTYKTEDPMTRTFRAYRRLLEGAFVTKKELSKWTLVYDDSDTEGAGGNDANLNDYFLIPSIFWTEQYVPNNKYEDHKLFVFGMKDPVDEDADKENKDPDDSYIEESITEESNLVESTAEEDITDVKEGEPDLENANGEPGALEQAGQGNEIPKDSDASAKKEDQDPTDKEGNNAEGDGEAMCICQDTVLGQPPPRSFRKWQFTSSCRGAATQTADVIVHCSHKYRGDKGEVLLEPIIEYQAELGASEQTDDRLKVLALGLSLRDDTTGVVNVRIDVQSGDVITIEELSDDQLNELKAPERMAEIGISIVSTLTRLQEYETGDYLLVHDCTEGEYALLFTEESPYAQPSETAPPVETHLLRDAGSSSDLSTTVNEPNPSQHGCSGDADCSHDEDFTSDAESSYEPGYSRVVGFSYDMDCVDPEGSADGDGGDEREDASSHEAIADAPRDPEPHLKPRAKAADPRDPKLDCTPKVNADGPRDPEPDVTPNANADGPRDPEPDWTPKVNVDGPRDPEPDCTPKVNADGPRDPEPDCTPKANADGPRDPEPDWTPEANADFSLDADVHCLLHEDTDFSLDADAACLLHADTDFSLDADAACLLHADTDFSPDADAACLLHEDTAFSLDADVTCSGDALAACKLDEDAASSHDADTPCPLDVDVDWSRDANARWSHDVDVDLNADCYLEPTPDCSSDTTWQPSEEDKRYAAWWHRVGHLQPSSLSSTFNVDWSHLSGLIDTTYSRNAASSRIVTYSRSAASARNAASTRDAASSHDAASSRDEASSRNAAPTRKTASVRDAASSRNAVTIRDAASSHDAASSRDEASPRNAAPTRKAASVRDAASSRHTASASNVVSTRDGASAHDDSSSDEGDQRDAGASRYPGPTPTLPVPVLGPALLPYHKFQKILPCAFTYLPENVVEERRQPENASRKPGRPIQLPEPEWTPRKKWTKKKGGKKNLRPH